MSKDYDIVSAFRSIEKELINSMLRNYKRHRAWERSEGFEWSMWQAEQLKSLQAYRKNNKKKFSTYFSTINDEIEEMIVKSYEAGNMEQEIKILKAVKKGYEPFNISEKVRGFIQEYKGKPLRDIAGDIISRIKEGRAAEFDGEFFKINDRKLNALLKATKEDFSKAEIAMLRKANDEYRKTIFNAQVYANTGAGTMKQAVDMATKDFLSKGINCIEYKNGARVNIADYVAMALRTANKRAYLQGEGAKRAEWGIHTVIVTKRGGGCPKCVPFQGKIFIDDVWSGGSSKDGDYPLLSAAMKAGLFHPNCKDTCTTFFPGINTEPNPPSKEEQKKSIEIYNMQQKQKYAERMVRKYKNLESGSLDKDNRKKYKSKKLQWQQVKSNLIANERNYNLFSVDFSQLNTKVYTDKYIDIGSNKKVGLKIRDEAISMMKHRNGTEYEDIAFYDYRTGKEVLKVTNIDIPRATGISKEQMEILKKYDGELIMLHNHPGGTRHSIADLVLSENIGKIKESIVAGHNGNVYIIMNQNTNINIEKIYKTLYNDNIIKFADKTIAERKTMYQIYSNSKLLTLKER